MALVCSIKSFSYILKCEYMTLGISKLNNIFPLHTNTQRYDISSIPMWCARCVNVNKILIKKVTRDVMLTNNIILAINRCETLRPLGALGI